MPKITTATFGITLEFLGPMLVDTTLELHHNCHPRLHTLMEGHTNFPFPLSFPSSVVLFGSTNCWTIPCRPASPVLAQLPRPKKEPGVSNRDINDFMDRGSLPFWSKVLEQHSTSSCSRQQVRQTLQQPLLPGTEWKVIATGGIDIWLAHQLPGKLEGDALTTPLISYSGQDVLL